MSRPCLCCNRGPAIIEHTFCPECWAHCIDHEGTRALKAELDKLEKEAPEEAPDNTRDRTPDRVG
jgi:hypothetical protein